MKKIIKENVFYISILVIFCALYFIKLPYYVVAPGGTIELNNRVEVDNEKIDGSINLLYVTQYDATIPTYVVAKIFRNWDLEDIEESQINNESIYDIEERNKIMLDNSIQNAIFVAYNKAGKDIKIKDSNSYVVGTTIDNNLKVGDIVLEVDGISIDNIKDVQKIVKEKEIGDSVKFKIIRNDKEIEVSNKVQEVEGNKIIGAVIITNYEYDLDPEIKFKFKNRESGASGGLMLALTIYDLVSGEDIVRGRRISGTGTIDADGNIGEIGGIKYKIMGAVRDKMDLILVPEDNYKEALEVKKNMKYDIEIVKVSNIDDAIKYLKNN